MNNMITLEQNAKRAKEQNSFYDYKAGSATAEYNGYISEAEQVAAAAISRLERDGAPVERIEKVNYLLERYKVKKLEWLNDINVNRARVPSVMIAGGSNFPVRAKEKQNERARKLMDDNPDYIIDKIKSVGYDSGTIRSDDPRAVERIKQKIESLKNAADPYGNVSAEIRRLKGRLLELAPEEFAKDMAAVTVNGVSSYDEIVALWDNGKVEKCGDDLYINLSLDFYNGKRHYREFLQVKVDESGKYYQRINRETWKYEPVELTDNRKYNLIIGKISGSGNKAVIYKHLRSLIPQAVEQVKEAVASDVVINGESANVVRNKEAVRLQLVFEGKPNEATRQLLKSNGFRWAPSATAWQRLLNGNSEIALRRITQ